MLDKEEKGEGREGEKEGEQERRRGNFLKGWREEGMCSERKWMREREREREREKERMK